MKPPTRAERPELFGLALASGDRTLAVPYLLGAAALFVLHRPGAWIREQARS